MEVARFLTEKLNYNNRDYAWPGKRFRVMRPFGSVLLHIYTP